MQARIIAAHRPRLTYHQPRTHPTKPSFSPASPILPSRSQTQARTAPPAPSRQALGSQDKKKAGAHPGLPNREPPLARSNPRSGAPARSFASLKQTSAISPHGPPRLRSMLPLG
ncbi:uncharacterized protein K452DRAFT_291525 [Aplosporella prunicola CBS 121167]|uniref:Uncharacterized protein n=1 Tax=Aplosporella prunicola CBS 121167 TaxID=1176127 RepID=A0A6A6B3B1_9PEZI|nr:uncharacterized protein K452DRAFT_291525 [Aplosporella prunicola CBS 121167]KAF2137477.1 hypothetical protein K452DRAFT_291525 [Aplosporella prunicola CBS 121167]